MYNSKKGNLFHRDVGCDLEFLFNIFLLTKRPLIMSDYYISVRPSLFLQENKLVNYIFY